METTEDPRSLYKYSPKGENQPPMTSIPEYHQIEEFQNRSKKLDEIRSLGIDPYPHKFQPDVLAENLKQEYENQDIGHSDDAASGSTPLVTVAGRLFLFRAMGKNAFGQIQDETGRVQFMCNRDLTKVEGLDPEKAGISHIKFIEKKIDLGDIVGIEGHLFRTQKGEITVFVKKLTLLCKTLLPLPDKHSGLADKGVRYRKRWLDLLVNRPSYDRLFFRSKIVSTIRKYMDDADFVEVETPILQNCYGGAEAEPFTSHLNALHQDMFLRISIEIPLKKLIVGGMHKVYEMGKVFRNEGLDRTHNPEFTEIEAYAAYWDYNDMMSFVEGMYEFVALELFGSTQIRVELDDGATSEVIDVKAPWKRMTMKDAIKDYGKHDVDAMSDEEIKKLLTKETNLDPKDIQKAPRGNLIAMMFEEFAESHLIQPHHITDHPIETTPFAKLHRTESDKDDGLVERFESFILGTECCNAYTELNDPELQRKLLVQQAEKRLTGDPHAPPLDEEFIEAICQGMPPTSGMGIGVDRIVMLFTSATSIRDVLYFPLLKETD